MTDPVRADQQPGQILPIDWATFLASCPPSVDLKVTGAFVKGQGYYNVALPPVKLYCESEHCSGDHFFDPHPKEESYGWGDKWKHYFIVFTCRHCKSSQKSISFLIKRYADSETDGRCYKLGEHPPFGRPIPARAITLIGGDRELFLKGYRSETQGLGIAAFAYYRRVVENQKDRLFDEIIKVAKHLKLPQTAIDELIKAKSETQFTKAVESIQPAIPPILLIDGHNPITLLHNALSKGLHSESDDECLQIAQSIRIILFELAERLKIAAKEDAEIRKALSRLLHQG